MGAAIGLGAAIGALLVVQGLTGPQPGRRDPGRRAHGRRGAGARARLVLQGLATALATAAAVLVLTGIPMAALLGAIVGGWSPSLVRRRRAATARGARRAAWPDAIDDLLTAVRAGVPLPEAMCTAAGSGPEPLRAGFAAYARAWRQGRPFTEALAAMQHRCADADADRVVVSLSLVMAAGGRNVGRVLATQSEFLRADLRMRGEIESRQSWTVNAARVAVAAPWLAVAALSIRGEAAAAYASPIGAVVLLITAGVGAAAYWVMTRIGALPERARLPEVGT
jgi:tight adherence protein B